MHVEIGWNSPFDINREGKRKEVRANTVIVGVVGNTKDIYTMPSLPVLVNMAPSPPKSSVLSDNLRNETRRQKLIVACKTFRLHMTHIIMLMRMMHEA